MRRAFLLFVVAIACVRAGAAPKPNFIFIMADDLGYGDIGCYGSTRIKTPNIDALAKGGMRFTDYHSNGPVCSPTRAALLTGRYQQRCNLEGVVTAKGSARQTGMPLQERTFAEALKAAGYRTGLFGKWHLGYRRKFNPTRQGFDEFVGYVSGNVDFHSHIDQAGVEDWWQGDQLKPEQGYVTDLITKHALRFIETHQDHPFCLYLPHEAPHYPYQGRQDPPGRTVGKPGVVQGARSDKQKAYQEMVEVMDEGVGRVVETVKCLGLEHRTFIVFCSDNGATALGNNGVLRGTKGTLFEGGHRVPAIAYWPDKIRPGSRTDQMALGMDWYPTMLALAGVDTPADLSFDGMDLSSVLLKGTPAIERTVFWRYKGHQALRKGAWKLLISRTAQKGGQDQPKTYLFDLNADLAEQTNLVQTMPEKLKQLQAELRAWEKDVDADGQKAVNQ
jgi:arylsulfatase A